MEKTYYPKAADLTQDWFLVDAGGQNLGRVATKIAALLLGKHTPRFTPGLDPNTHVVVINAGKIEVTGTKLTVKTYYRHSQYPGGLKAVALKDQLAKYPDRVIRSAVWGMLPHNKLGRKLILNLKVYGGDEHPHAAQQPKPA